MIKRISAFIAAAAIAISLPLSLASPAIAFSDKGYRFFSIVRQLDPAYNKFPNKLLKKYGLTICKALRAGATPREVILMNVATGGEYRMVMVGVTSAMAAYCPEQSKKL